MTSRWLLLPLVGVLSLVAIALPMEIAARYFYREFEQSPRACLVLNDPTTGVRGVPNCSTREKSAEADWVEYKYNNCGHRNAVPCGPKPPGVFRIVMLGSSLPQGATVPYDKSFAALLPKILSEQMGRPIELYNEGMAWGTPHSMALQFDAALAQQPDMIFWPVGPWDISRAELTVPDSKLLTGPDAVKASAPETSKWERLKARLFGKRTLDITDSLTARSRAFFMIQHWLYKSDSIYLSHSLTGTDEYASSLQDKPAKDWEDKLRAFDTYTAQMSARAKAANVPFVVTALPRHAQIVMIAAGLAPSGVDPYAFGEQIKDVVEKDGGTYIDVLQRFKTAPNVSTAFYPVDQHLTVQGQQMFAQVLANGLMEDALHAAPRGTHAGLSPAN
jgi:hypothetical protein